MTKEAKIYQLKITLKYIRPPIWRRIQVGRDITLAALHRFYRLPWAGMIPTCINSERGRPITVRRT
jgi:hypothetical protein